MNPHRPSRWAPAGYLLIMIIFLALSLVTIRPGPSAHQIPQQAYDSGRKMLFSADPVTADIHVLNLYHNVASLADLRAPERHVIHDMRLTREKHSLWVLADSGIYRYDTHTLKLTGFRRGHFIGPHRFAQVSERDATLQTQQDKSTGDV